MSYGSNFRIIGKKMKVNSLSGKKIVNMNLTNGPKIQQIEIEVLNQIKNRLNAVNAHQKTLEKGNNIWMKRSSLWELPDER